MSKSKHGLITQKLAPVLMLLALAWMPVAGANPVDKSDMNNDGVVNISDLAIFSQTYLGQDWRPRKTSIASKY
jgi:hypothetical protein